MNKIRVVNNEIIPCDNSDISIVNNEISFLNSGNFAIEYIDCNDVNLNIIVKENTHVCLFVYSNNDYITTMNKYNIFGNLVVNKFYYNNNTDETINVILSKDKANFKYNFSSVSSGNDKFTINIYHLKKDTCSDICNRTVAKENSSNVFDINSYVENGILNTYLNQQTKIVTLGDSNNKINPNMFIGEASTTGIHSSTIGTINEEDIFYLMSRGIDYETAIKLIIKGMIISNINPDMEYREKILELLNDLGGE